MFSAMLPVTACLRQSLDAALTHLSHSTVSPFFVVLADKALMAGCVYWLLRWFASVAVQHCPEPNGHNNCGVYHPHFSNYVSPSSNENSLSPYPAFS
jgi:hypothetical protein